jgi:hypothetical protein
MAKVYPSTVYVCARRCQNLTKTLKLQNPQLVTSYALPPSATFTIAPFSVYRKGTSKTSSERFTYAYVKGSTQTDKAQLVCFREKSVGDRTETAKTTYTPAGDAEILALDALPVTPGGSSPTATHDVLATFNNGDILCLRISKQFAGSPD